MGFINQLITGGQHPAPYIKYKSWTTDSMSIFRERQGMPTDTFPTIGRALSQLSHHCDVAQHAFRVLRPNLTPSRCSMEEDMKLELHRDLKVDTVYGPWQLMKCTEGDTHFAQERRSCLLAFSIFQLIRPKNIFLDLSFQLQVWQECSWQMKINIINHQPSPIPRNGWYKDRPATIP